MSKKNTEKIIDLIGDDTVCANESTGALQKVSIDPDEVAKYHSRFIGEDK